MCMGYGWNAYVWGMGGMHVYGVWVECMCMGYRLNACVWGMGGMHVYGV